MPKLLRRVALVSVIVIFLCPAPSNAVTIDGHGWVKLTQQQKVSYLMGYWDGVIAGIGQGVRFAMNSRTPDKEVFSAAYDLWADVGIETLLPKIDQFYSNTSKRQMTVMLAITQILVDMKLLEIQQK
jgi:hypothetical protein